MTTSDYLHHLADRGIGIVHNNGTLIARGADGVITPEVLDELRQRKPDLLARFAQVDAALAEALGLLDSERATHLASMAPARPAVIAVYEQVLRHQYATGDPLILDAPQAVCALLGRWEEPDPQQPDYSWVPPPDSPDIAPEYDFDPEALKDSPNLYTEEDDSQ